jgi:plasmid stability protein
MTITNEKRTRLTIDVPPEVKRRLRIAAARRDISMRQYVLEVLEERLADDLPPLIVEEGLLALTAEADPVLAELWDNDKDAAYDHL